MKIWRLVLSVRLLLVIAGLLVFPDLTTLATAAPEILIEEAGTPLGTGLVTGWGGNASGQTSAPADLSGVQAISAGYYHSVALKNDGTVIAWGSNNSGESTVPAGLTGVQAIATGVAHTVALKSDGTILAWGDNSSGQVDVPAGLAGVRAIAAGWKHTVALKDDGTVVAWGYNLSGQTTVPAGLTGVQAIAAGSSHTVVLKNDGTVVGWGNYIPLLNMPAGLSSVQAIAAGEYHTMALKSDGTVVVWGNNSNGQLIVPTGLSGVKAIAAGQYHSVALKIDGTLVAWGKNDSGQTTVPAALRNMWAVSAGRTNTMVLMNSTLVFGDQGLGTTSVAKTFTIKNTGDGLLDLSGVSLSGDQASDFFVDTTGMLTSIPTGGQTTFTVRFTPGGGGVRRTNLRVLSNDSDEGAFDFNLVGTRSFPDIAVEQPTATPLATGSVAAWGWNAYQQTDVPVSLSGVYAIAASTWHTAALKNDGTVVIWGGTSAGQAAVPAGLEHVIAIAAGQNHTLALSNDGKVTGWPGYQDFQTSPPSGLSGVRAIAAGEYHSIALKTDGTVVAWGKNTYGQALVPAGLSGVQAIAANGSHSVALKTDGTVVAWGTNSDGESVVPAGLSGVMAIAAGVYHTVALKSDGTVVAWGRNSSGQTTVPAGLSDVQAIAAGTSHTVALKRDGSIVAWGSNSSGQAIPPAGLTGVTAIAAGGSHNVVLLNSTVDFGNHALGLPGEPKIFKIRNTGADLLHISSVGLTGDSAADFTLDTTGILTTLPAGGETICTVAFNPAAPGVKRAILRVLSDDPDEGSFDVSLTGSVIPEIAVFNGPGANATDERADNAGLHTFPDTFLGNSSAAQTFTIKNTGLSALNNIALTVAGTHPGDFVCGSLGAASLAPDAVTTFTVHFAPTGPGKRDAVIAIASNDLDENPFEIRVTGKNPAPEISIEHPADTPLATGIVIAWGDNTYGQSTVPASALPGIRAVAAGDHHTVALKVDGSVVAWGSNLQGQADVPPGLTDVQAITAGYFHNLVLKGDGTVVAWGFNTNGQSTVPAGLTGVNAIAAGLYHSVALKNDGKVVAWGYNNYGQTSVPGNLTGVRAIAAGLNHNLAIKNDSTVVAWGSNGFGQCTVPTGLTEVQAVSAGIDHSAALKSDGTVIVWGSNQYGQRNVPAGLSGVMAISAGEFHTVALKDSLVVCGDLALGSPSAPQTFTIRNTGNDDLHISNVETLGGNASDFSADISGMLATVPAGGQTSFNTTFTPSANGVRRTTLRVTSNDPDESKFDISLTGTGLLPEISIEQGDTILQTGTVAAWGSNTSGQTAVPAGLSGVRAIAAGGSLTMALKGDGSVVAWGNNGNGVAMLPFMAKSGVIATAIGSTHALAVKSDGSVIGWGVNSSGQSTPPAGLTGVSAIAAGSAHSLALKSDGSVIAWGNNGNGQANLPLNAQSSVQAIAANSLRTMVLKGDGTVIAWGDNNYGQSTVPSGLTDVRVVAAGARHSMALKNDGSIVAWGNNTYGQTIIPASLTGLRTIAANGLHNLALKDDGTVVAWGYNFYGQTNVPVGLTGVKAIAAGSDHSVALLDSTMTFGSQAIGTSGTARTFTIRNTGLAPLNITGLSATGGNTSDFNIDTSGMTAAIPVGGQTTFSATFTPVASGFRKTTLRVLTNDSDEGTFDIVLAGTGLTPLESWRQFHFGTTANTGITADSADSDQDGLVNLVEFAFGTDPTTSTPSEHRPQASTVLGQFVITYRRPVGGVPGITYGIEQSSNNLENWHAAAIPTDYTRSLSPNGDGTETVTITWIDSLPDSGFFRVSVFY